MLVMNMRNVIFRLLKEYKHKWPLFFVVTVGGLVGTGSMVVYGILLRPMVDALVDGNPRAFRDALPYLITFFLLEIVIGILAGKAQARLGEDISRDLQKRIVRKISRLSIEDAEKVHSGDFVSLFNHDLIQLSSFLSNEMSQSFGYIFSGVAGILVMLWFNWQLTLISMILVPLFMLLADQAGKPLAQLTATRNQLLAAVNEQNQDAVAGYAEIKSFSLYRTLQKAYAESIDKVISQSIRITRTSALTHFTAFFARLIPVILVISLGVFYVIQDRMTLGELLTIIQVSNVPLGMLAFFGPGILIPWKRARGNAERLYGLLDQTEERTGGRQASLPDNQPVIRFDNVYFSYGNQTDQQTDVLKGISFEIRKGQKVAFVGESGCGKSTILKLITGYYVHQSGNLEVGGLDIREWDLSAMRNHMALVEQETYLFPGTIYENIALGGAGQPEISPEKVKEAARTAGISEFVESLEKGYETPMQERGIRFSGGQRQRVAIARAFMKDCEILLLDEPTSSLDAQTEKLLEKELAAAMEGKTVILVAHRLATVRDADRIYVIQNGIIAEEGNHRSLLAKRGVYQALLARQQEEGEA